MTKLTAPQKTSLRRALAAYPGFVRATSSGERVALASLYRNRGLLTRRPWRGEDGAPDAAYEYRAADELVAAVNRRRNA